MQFNLKVRPGAFEKIDRYLKALPRGTVKAGLAAIAEYIIGDGTRGLKQYGAYKYVTRRRAYGSTFKSEKQRRYVMARIREGSIDPGVPHRTGRTQRGYMAKEARGGYAVQITNKEPGAYFTRDDTGQARLNALAGWKKAGAVVKSNMAGALRHANAAVRAFLKR